MTLSLGSRVGPYEITGVLGTGGMGEVYRARDSVLGREVALKVLPEAVAADRERVARFAREARFLASLDHPNVGAIYGWESSSGIQAIVLELIEGPTLRDRIAAGPVPLDQALGIARQIADALEAAHDQGVVHRDLKPANIKVRPDGRVKVLDFGLAKALAPDETTAASATTVADTESGIVVGTPAYMSPEQARGETVTRKTDVWSFGVVLFEMLSGRHPFGTGPSTEVMAAILRATPEWEALPSGTPPAVTRLLRRCLEKDPRSRIHDIGDARLEIEDAISGRSSSPSGSTHTTGGAPTRRWSRGAQLGGAAAAIAVVGAAIAAGDFIGARRATAPPAMVRLSIVPPSGAHFASTPAVSPDGSMIAFVAATPGSGGQLFIRTLASALPTPLAGTDGATFPFWSPNGRSVAFFANQKLERIDVGSTDRPKQVCDAPAGRGGAWLDDETIIFTPDSSAPLSRVSASGGQPVAFTTINTADGEQDHRFPTRIPGGYLLYLVVKGSPQESGARLVALSAPNKVLKFYQGIAAAEYADGFLIFLEAGQVKARRMHLPDGELGAEVPIGTARTSVSLGRAALSAAAGVVAFIDPGEPTLGQFVWRARDGSTTGTLGEPGPNSGVELSPNRQELVTLRDSDNALSVMDITQPAVLNPVLKSASAAQFPLWSSDGSQIVFMTVAGVAPNTGRTALWSVSPTGNTPAAPQTPPGRAWLKPAASIRAGMLAWLQQRNGHDWDIWMKRPDQDAPVPYLQNGARNAEARLSSDGSWLAFATDQSGRFEIVVQSFPSPDRKFSISADGGRFPRWRPDGQELYYLTRDFSALMAVSVTPGSPPKFGAPHKLFEVRLVTTPDPEQIVFGTYQYDVADNAGARFLINQLVREPVQALDVILNWNRK